MDCHRRFELLGLGKVGSVGERNGRRVLLRCLERELLARSDSGADGGQGFREGFDCLEGIS